MKKQSFISICACLALLLGGCNDEVGNEFTHCNHFIFQYYDGEIALQPLGDTEGAVVGFCLQPAHELREKRGWIPEGTDSFLSIAEQYKDVAFDTYVGPGVACGTAYADSFAALEVVSDAAWDEAHPAGTSLNDLLQVEYATYREFVDADYRGCGEYLPVSYGSAIKQEGITSHEKRLSELMPTDMELVACLTVQFRWDPRIYFLSAPTLAEEHTLTLRWTTTEGEVLSGSIRIRPEKYVREK